MRQIKIAVWPLGACMVTIVGCGRIVAPPGGPSVAFSSSRSSVMEIDASPGDPSFPKDGFEAGDQEATWFWSAGRFSGPNVPVAKGKAAEVIVHLTGSFPPQVNPHLTVTDGGQQVFAGTLQGLALHRDKTIGPIKVPAAVHNGKLDLQWAVTTWVPSALGINPQDHRKLGLDIETIEVREAH
jgi:hypothetical protein